MKKTFLIANFLILPLSFTEPAKRTLSSDFGSNVVNRNITEKEIELAQQSWGKALIQISSDFDSKGIKAATKTATKVLDSAYAYNMGTVLFKPTLTHGDQTFRTTKESALAYFVGNNKKFPNDSGFALKGWRDYSFKNAAVYIDGDKAVTMGKVSLVDKTGAVTVVDKTWGFKKSPDGNLRIFLHHSSLPYQPAATKAEVTQN
jgi:hypothetical protein